MCGIIGITSNKNIKKDLIKCLKNLEYRGYDSVGIFLKEIIKTKGRISDLEKLINNKLDGTSGLGHSRWATHGIVNDLNAHPFISYNKKFVLVHNGIINNYLNIKDNLLHDYKFTSETDSEVICNLLDFYYKNNKDTLKALELTLEAIKGSYALGIINIDEPNRIYFAKKESPLIIGKNQDFNFIVSDINSSHFLTNEFIILNDDEYGYIDNQNICIYSNYEQINKNITFINSENKEITKDGFEHFMIKEIYDEPKILKNIINTYTFDNKIIIDPLFIETLKHSSEINILGCGTSYHAGLIGKEIIEKLTNKKVNVYLASEFQNTNILNENAPFIFLSQSGETIDLKLAYNNIKNNDKIYTFTNVLTSSLAQLSNKAFDLLSGIEIAVASTKAYISEVTLLTMIAYKLIDKDEVFINEIYNCINSINKTLNNKNNIYGLAKQIKDSTSLFFLGRGTDHLINLENSLKLKEVSYIHSEAFYGGELKHGSIALISEGTNVLGLITSKKYSSLLSNIKEVESRHANVNLISTSNLNINCNYTIDCYNELFAPIVVAPFFQLLSYYCAKLNNRDIDKPRNLAKSCTVE